MKTKVRLLRDIEFGDKIYPKNTLIEINEAPRGLLCLYNDHGGSYRLDIQDASIINGRELYTREDMDSMIDWTSDRYLDEAKELRNQIAKLTKEVGAVTDMNLILEEKLYQLQKKV